MSTLDMDVLSQMCFVYYCEVDLKPLTVDYHNFILQKLSIQGRLISPFMTLYNREILCKNFMTKLKCTSVQCTLGVPLLNFVNTQKVWTVAQ